MKRIVHVIGGPAVHGTEFTKLGETPDWMGYNNPMVDEVIHNDRIILSNNQLVHELVEMIAHMPPNSSMERHYIVVGMLSPSKTGLPLGNGEWVSVDSSDESIHMPVWAGKKMPIIRLAKQHRELFASGYAWVDTIMVYESIRSILQLTNYDHSIVYADARLPVECMDYVPRIGVERKLLGTDEPFTSVLYRYDWSGKTLDEMIEAQQKWERDFELMIGMDNNQ